MAGAQPLERRMSWVKAEWRRGFARYRRRPDALTRPLEAIERRAQAVLADVRELPGGDHADETTREH